MPSGNEGLVELIADGVEQRQREAICTYSMRDLLPQGPPDQSGQHSIDKGVCTLFDDEVEPGLGCPREVRLRREPKDHAHPEDHPPPQPQHRSE